MRYIKLDVCCDYLGEIPSFIGSMLRGTYGVALKDVSCVNPKFECQGCFATSSCAYYRCYESKNQKSPIRFEYDLEPKRLDFSLYVFGDMTTQLPYLLSALQKMVEQKGFGAERQKGKIRSISSEDKILYDEKEFASLEDIKPKEFICDKVSEDVTIKLLTPLRIKEDNRYARKTIRLQTLLNSIAMIERELDGVMGRGLGYEISYGDIKSKLEFVDYTRYSNRQKTKMQFGGLVGQVDVSRLDARSYRLLKLGEIVGIGKSTMFGLGRIKVEDRDG
ncbi:MAG: CRISPR system precrRNA processing endoribonuclease RAMP protein Cas6 [Campylobacterales bacterium]